MPAVFVQRPREPASTFTLMSFQPGDTSLNSWIRRSEASSSQNIQGKTGSIAVTRLNVLRFRIGSFPVPQCRQPPTPVWFLQGQQVVDNLLFFRAG